MLYDNYVRRMERLNKVLNFVYKFRFVIGGTIVAITGGTLTMLGIKGIVQESYEFKSTYVYGEKYNPTGKALMNAVQYEYRSVDSSEWSEVIPSDAGSYYARPYSYNGFGAKTYGTEASFVIAQKPIEVTIKESSITYGDSLTLANIDLTSGDKVESFSYHYDENYFTEHPFGEEGNKAFITKAFVNEDDFKIVNSNGEDKTNNYAITFVEKEVAINKRPITITTGSASKQYDATALTNETYRITSGSIVEGDELTIGGYSSVILPTLEGAVENNVETIIIKSEEYNRTDFYDINLVKGELKVDLRDISLTSNDIDRVYNGEVLTQETESEANKLSYEVSKDSLLEGHHIEVEFAEENRYIGETSNEFTYKIFDENNVDVTTSLYNVTPVFGDINIAKYDLNISAKSGSKLYDATPLTTELNHDEVVATDTLTITNSPTGKDSIIDPEYTEFSYSYEITHKDDLWTDYNEVYNVITSGLEGSLNIDKLELYIDGPSFTERAFNGNYIVEDEIKDAVISGHKDEFEALGYHFEFDVDDSIYNEYAPGSYAIDYIYNIKDKEGNIVDNDFINNHFIITYNTNSANITMKDVSIIFDDVELIYDGEEHAEYSAPTVTGLNEIDVLYYRLPDSHILPYTHNFEESEMTLMINNPTLGDVTSFYNITLETPSFNLAPRIINLTSNDVIRDYNGYALSKEATEEENKLTLTIDGEFVKGDYIEYYFDFENRYIADREYDGIDYLNTFHFTIYDVNGDYVTDNRYDIRDNPGIIDISRKEVRVILDNYTSEKKYDGEALNAPTYKYVKGYELASTDSLNINLQYSSDGMIYEEATSVSITDPGWAYFRYNVIEASISNSNLLAIYIDEVYDFRFDTRGGYLRITGLEIEIDGPTFETRDYNGKKIAPEEIIASNFGGDYQEFIDAGYSFEITVDSSLYNQYAAGNYLIEYDYIIKDKDGNVVDSLFADAHFTIYRTVHRAYINPKEASITFSDTKYTYDGTQHVAYNAPEVIGLVEEDYELHAEAPLYLTTGIYAFDELNLYVDIYHPTFGNVTDCYYLTITYPTCEIEGKAIRIVSNSINGEYNGEKLSKDATSEDRRLTASLHEDDALVEGHTITFLNSSLEGRYTTEGSTKNFWTFIIKDALDNDVTDQYNVDYTSFAGTVNVTKKEITIKYENNEITYDGEYHAVYTAGKYTIIGVIDGDDMDFVDKTPTDEFYADVNEVSINADYEYTIKRGTEYVNSNYIIKVINPKLTIKKRNITITTNTPDSKVYDGTPLDLYMDIGGEGLASGDTNNSTFTYANHISFLDNVENSYTLDIRRGSSLNVNDNYNITEVVLGKLNITKRDLVVRTNAVTYTYDGLPHTYETSTNDGLIASDKISGIAFPSYTNAGTYKGSDIKLQTSSIYNETYGVYVDNAYNVSYDLGDIVINKRKITFTDNELEHSKLYNGESIENDYDPNTIISTTDLLADSSIKDEFSVSIEYEEDEDDEYYYINPTLLSDGEYKLNARVYRYDAVEDSYNELTDNYTFLYPTVKFTIKASDITYTNNPSFLKKDYDGEEMSENDLNNLIVANNLPYGYVLEGAVVTLDDSVNRGLHTINVDISNLKITDDKDNDVTAYYEGLIKTNLSQFEITKRRFIPSNVRSNISYDSYEHRTITYQNIDSKKVRGFFDYGVDEEEYYDSFNLLDGHEVIDGGVLALKDAGDTYETKDLLSLVKIVDKDGNDVTDNYYFENIDDELYTFKISVRKVSDPGAWRSSTYDGKAITGDRYVDSGSGTGSSKVSALAQGFKSAGAYNAVVEYAGDFIGAVNVGKYDKYIRVYAYDEYGNNITNNFYIEDANGKQYYTYNSELGCFEQYIRYSIKRMNVNITVAEENDIVYDGKTKASDVLQSITKSVTFNEVAVSGSLPSNVQLSINYSGDTSFSDVGSYFSYIDVALVIDGMRVSLTPGTNYDIDENVRVVYKGTGLVFYNISKRDISVNIAAEVGDDDPTVYEYITNEGDIYPEKIVVNGLASKQTLYIGSEKFNAAKTDYSALNNADIEGKYYSIDDFDLLSSVIIKDSAGNNVNSNYNITSNFEKGVKYIVLSYDF